MEFVLRKVNYASFNGLLRRKILSIAGKCNEISDESDSTRNFNKRRRIR